MKKLLLKRDRNDRKVNMTKIKRIKRKKKCPLLCIRLIHD